MHFSHRGVGLAIGMALIATAAQAGDDRSNPTALGEPSWRGFYLGANLGYGWASTNAHQFDMNNPAQPIDVGGVTISPRGATVGVQAGYNYQVGNFVLGGEADFGYLAASKKDTELFQGLATIHLDTMYKSIATARLTAGYAISSLLIYATAGPALADIEDSYHNTSGFIPMDFRATASRWTPGAAFGGGLQYALDDHWSVKSEYLYARFRDLKTPFTLSGESSSITYKHELQVVRASLNYRF
ncbi:outer membrane beta-barrel protein [Mesorhizobium sp. WSM4884]|uniref:outer membrane protein n=1 Tax=Mesorhizobium sp. WSM4884 TaxID=3038542 RepID=UPI002417DEC1|nr:outer membrane beta-barrel protein [Mesorhizobium sp. WSM4884]MDG4880767.1 outer membrane beta-barrel protein [Mesorhizobium sp. WSM4884]